MTQRTRSNTMFQLTQTKPSSTDSNSHDERPGINLTKNLRQSSLGLEPPGITEEQETHVSAGIFLSENDIAVPFTNETPPKRWRDRPPTILRNSSRWRNNATTSPQASERSLVQRLRKSSLAHRVERATRWRNNATTSPQASERSLAQRLRKSSLAHRVEKVTVRVRKTVGTKRLWGVALTLVFSLALVNGMVYMFNEMVINALYPNENTKKNFRVLDNPYQDIVKDTIPFIQNWYHEFKHKNEPLLPFVTIRNRRRDKVVAYKNFFEKEDDCLGRWFNDIQYDLVPNENETVTSPDIIKKTLQSMGLLEQPLIRSHLDDLLTTSQSLDGFFKSSYKCLSSSPAILQLACTAEGLYPNRLSKTTTPERSYILDALHKAMTIEKLTNLLRSDFTSLYQVADTMGTGQLLEFEKYISRVYSKKPAQLAEATLAKYYGQVFSLRALASAISQNQQRESDRQALQLSILEAVKTDIHLGHDQNARVGLALAAATSFGPTLKDHKYTWRLGNDWVDAYIAWNIAYVTGTLPLAFLSQVMIPFVSCTLQSEGGTDFAQARIIALSLALLQIQEPLFSAIETDSPKEVATMMEKYYSDQTDLTPEKSALALALGRTNFDGGFLAIPISSTDAIETMLYELCGEQCHYGSWRGSNSNPVTNLDDDRFHVYLGYVLWVTVLLAGLGLELLVLLNFLQHGWSSELEARWRLAQFVFPLLAAATLGLALRQNYLALLLLVPGLWKFGFPETIMYLYSGLYKSSKGASATRLQRAIELISGIGTVIHHGAASLLIVMLLAGAAKPAQCIVNPILILLMQHWFVLMKYVNALLYTVLELVLEVWFEWVVIAELEELFANHWTTALSANCMLVAHWLYLTSATLDLWKVHVVENGIHKIDFGKSDRTRHQYLQAFRKSKITPNSSNTGKVLDKQEQPMRTIRLEPVEEGSMELSGTEPRSFCPEV